MLPGMVYFVSIHMVPLVPRGPVGKVYRDVPEACKPLFGFKRKRSGKGLSSEACQILVVTAVAILLLLVIIIFHGVITRLDMRSTGCVAWAVRGA